VYCYANINIPNRIPYGNRRTHLASGEDTAAFLDALTRSPQLKVLSVLVERPQEELTKTEIAQKAGIGRTTLYRVWDDLEKMKAIAPSRHVGAVTLYRLNPQSSIVQSLMNITKGLSSVTSAVGRIEEIREVEKLAKEEFGKDMPSSVSVLVKLQNVNAIDESTAAQSSALKLSKIESDSIQSLIGAGLIESRGGKLNLTTVGSVTAQGASKIWGESQRETIQQTLASAKVALELINQEIKKLQGMVQKE
jgi:Fe2+ or Zn2+ uptake regulation protein